MVGGEVCALEASVAKTRTEHLALLCSALIWLLWCNPWALAPIPRPSELTGGGMLVRQGCIEPRSATLVDWRIVLASGRKVAQRVMRASRNQEYQGDLVAIRGVGGVRRRRVERYRCSTDLVRFSVNAVQRPHGGLEQPTR